MPNVKVKSVCLNSTYENVRRLKFHTFLISSLVAPSDRFTPGESLWIVISQEAGLAPEPICIRWREKFLRLPRSEDW
jgi:hypothetical protein